MPAEPTKAKLKRKSSRKDLDDYRFDGTHARELELKRNRGEVSCAECRRLKIKCDKQIPCQSCQRRGCAALCPNGSLATGQGTRFVLAATEHLYRRITRLSGRIRDLEDALAGLQAKYSDEPHPLLQKDLVQPEDNEDAGGPPGEQGWPMDESMTAVAGPSHSADVIDAFGTLSISDHGISRFFGPTGGSECLLIVSIFAARSAQLPTFIALQAKSNTNPESNTSPDNGYNPDTNRSAVDLLGPSDLEELRLFSMYFPFTPIGRPLEVQKQVESHLPPWERAVALVETYFEQVSWIFRGVTRIQLIDEMLPVIYRRHDPVPGEEYTGPHDLALVFIVFAIGALVEPEPSNALGEHYHQIARAAISLQAVLEKPSIVTIQTLHLMSIYNAMSGSDLRSETSMEMTWSLVTLASHLSQTIGLHRDSARWGLSPKMVQRRRVLFWDLFVADVWQSLNTGRPPSFSLAYIDCSYPQYDTGGKNNENSFGSAFEVWQCRFAAECVADVTARTLTAEAPSYATIMELDRKVREFPLPEGFSNASPNDLATSFQRCVLDHIRETVLMYMHRSFFAQAIIDQPVNPLKSAYAPSFLAAYRASATILKSVREQFSIWPNSCSRFWTMWTFAFTAAVVFGTVVTRGPRSPLAQSAMAELEQACILFSKASVYSIRATKALPILTKLSEKARYALAAAQSDSGPQAGLHWNIKEEKEDDELAIFAGHTRFVSAAKANNNNVAASTTTVAATASTSAHHRSSSQVILEQLASSSSYVAQGSQDASTALVIPRVHSESSLQLHSTSSATQNRFNYQDEHQQQHQLQHHQPQHQHHHQDAQPTAASNPPAVTIAVNVNINGIDNWASATASSTPLRGNGNGYQYPTPVEDYPPMHYPSRPNPQVPVDRYAPQQWMTESQPQHQYQGHLQHHYDAAAVHYTNAQSHQQQSVVPVVEHHPIHDHNHRGIQQPTYATQMQSQHDLPPQHATYLQATTTAVNHPMLYDHHHQHQHTHTLAQMYNHHTHGYYQGPTTSDLADLGLASRDSRLDERWSSFIHDSGLIDDVHYDGQR